MRIMPGPPVAIYALINRGKIRYVGQTDRPVRREQQWRNRGNPQRKEKRIRVFAFTILRFTESDDALRIEAQIIRACKKRGWADLNRHQGSTAGKFHSLKRAFFWIEKRAIFLTTNHVAYHFNISMATAIQSQRKYGGRTTIFGKFDANGFPETVGSGTLVRLSDPAFQKYWPNLKLCILIALHRMGLRDA